MNGTFSRAQSSFRFSLSSSMRICRPASGTGGGPTSRTGASLPASDSMARALSRLRADGTRSTPVACQVSFTPKEKTIRQGS